MPRALAVAGEDEGAAVIVMREVIAERGDDVGTGKVDGLLAAARPVDKGGERRLAIARHEDATALAEGARLIVGCARGHAVRTVLPGRGRRPGIRIGIAKRRGNARLAERLGRGDLGDRGDETNRVPLVEGGNAQNEHDRPDDNPDPAHPPHDLLSRFSDAIP